MGITINISGSATTLPLTSNPDAEVMSLDAGASVAHAPTGTDPTARAHTRDRALDGGSPSASLVQEIEAALLIAGATKQNTSSSVDGLNAGAAPV